MDQTADSLIEVLRGFDAGASDPVPVRTYKPDCAERASIGIYDIGHWSVGLGLKILARTLPAVIGGRGAY